MSQFLFTPAFVDSGFLILLGLFFAYLWVAEFVRLMSAREDAFPGPYLRLAWVAGFLFVWWLTPFAFLYWRKSHARVRRPRHVYQPPKNKVDIASDVDVS